MATNDYQPPDLASILATLAAYTPTPQPQSFHVAPPSAPAPELSEDEYLPRPAETPQAPVTSPGFQAPENPIHHPRPIDPATLTTWPSALRCVTRTIARNEAAMARIRQLIRTQQQHERQWWAGREALVQKQRQRGEGRKALDDVLKAVGGKIDTTRSDPTPEEDRTELHRYDRKVHTACSAMIRATISELKALGVPFFGMKPDMILRADETGTGGAERKFHDGKIEERELERLQGRMLELLEDLCKE